MTGKDVAAGSHVGRGQAGGTNGADCSRTIQRLILSTYEDLIPRRWRQQMALTMDDPGTRLLHTGELKCASLSLVFGSRIIFFSFSVIHLVICCKVEKKMGGINGTSHYY